MSETSYFGKVRECRKLADSKLAMIHSDRQSGFDRYLCDIPDKGWILTSLSAWWFKKTSHLVPNHYLNSEKNLMTVRECKQFPIEVIVRAYITGSTKTSLWTHYASGKRTYCGIKFPDGLQKHQAIDIVITPTTKGDTDEPISEKQILERGILTASEWETIRNYSLTLFRYGQTVAADRGLILVDTKMEFGRAVDSGEIIVSDELFTIDSSRFWLASSYQERFENGIEPERFDKDQVREWVKSRCDPYKDELPTIPTELCNRVSQVYHTFYQQLTGHKLK